MINVLINVIRNQTQKFILEIQIVAIVMIVVLIPVNQNMGEEKPVKRDVEREEKLIKSVGKLNAKSAEERRRNQEDVENKFNI